MLVLSRRKEETIMIGDDVEITIVDVKGDAVRLGIKAPRSVSVHRKEIYDAIQAENIAAARESVPDGGAVGGLGSLLKGTEGHRYSALGKLSGGRALGPPPAAGLNKLSSLSRMPKNPRVAEGFHSPGPGSSAPGKLSRDQAFGAPPEGGSDKPASLPRGPKIRVTGPKIRVTRK